MSKSQCSLCDKWYSTKFNLNKHLKKVHNLQWDLGLNKPYGCEYCSRKYNYRKALIEHMRRKHASFIGEKNKAITNNYNKCYYCNESFMNLKSLRQHLSNVHLVNIEYSEKVFKTNEDFITWKKLEEKNSKSQFVKHCGAKTLLKGDIVQYFECSRSGAYHCIAKPSEKKADENKAKARRRKLKKIGTRKIQRNCTASITLSINSKGYCVQYWSTHIGHEIEIDHLTRPLRQSLLSDSKHSGQTDVHSTIIKTPKIPINSSIEYIDIGQFVVETVLQTENEDNFDVNGDNVIQTHELSESPTPSEITNTENISNNNILINKVELLLSHVKSVNYDQVTRKKIENLLDKLLVLSNKTSSRNTIIHKKCTKNTKSLKSKKQFNNINNKISRVFR